MELKVKSFGEISMADYVPGAEVLVSENQVRTSVQYLNNIILYSRNVKCLFRKLMLSHDSHLWYP